MPAWGTIPNGVGYGPGTARGVLRPAAAKKHKPHVTAGSLLVPFIRGKEEEGMLWGWLITSNSVQHPFFPRAEFISGKNTPQEKHCPHISPLVAPGNQEEFSSIIAPNSHKANWGTDTTYLSDLISEGVLDEIQDFCLILSFPGTDSKWKPYPGFR